VENRLGYLTRPAAFSIPTVTHSINVHPHAELNMVPHVGFDTDQIKDKARKDLLYLLEGVSKGSRLGL
jgi:hypothetical protein